jgi:hypothetical protein
LPAPFDVEGAITERIKMSKKKADLSIIWLAPAIVSPYLILGGLWSLSQPWGGTWEKIFVILLFSAICLVSIYFLNERKITLTGVKRKKRIQLIFALGSALFVICGLIIVTIRHGQWVTGLMTSVVFSIFSIIFTRNYRRL